MSQIKEHYNKEINQGIFPGLQSIYNQAKELERIASMDIFDWLEEQNNN